LTTYQDGDHILPETRNIELLEELAETLQLGHLMRDMEFELKMAIEHHELNATQGIPCCAVCSTVIAELRAELELARSPEPLTVTPEELDVQPQADIDQILQDNDIEPPKRRRARKTTRRQNQELPSRSAGRQRVKNKVDRWRNAVELGADSSITGPLKEEARQMRDWFNETYGGNVYPDLF
jgi:hypothetical protein